MKTPMQELIEWMSKVTVVLPDESGPDESVGARNQMIICKMKAESLLDKEKEVIMEAWDKGKASAEEYYNETFNTKER